MKKFCVWVLAALLVLTLWGCECSHEWYAADCLTPKTCAKCGETEGIAAGHFWQAATCEVPETCQECGLTQGEAGHKWQEATCNTAKTCTVCGLLEGAALEHDYVFEKFCNDEMQYRCQVCAAVSNQAMDRELYANYLILGHWDLNAVQSGTTLSSAANTLDVGAYLVGKEDGTILFHTEAGRILDVTMEYVGYEKTDLGGNYSVVFVSGEDQTRYEAEIREQAGQKQMTVVLDAGKSVILQQNPEIEEVVAQTWYDINNDQMYFMDLKRDRSFTANFDGGISGTWHIKPIYLYYGYDTFNLTLSYNMGDKSTVRNLIIILGPEGEGLASLQSAQPMLSMQLFNDFKTQKQLNMRIPYEADEKYTVIPEDAVHILGNWVTRDVYYYSYEDRTSTPQENPGYTAVFNEDGTFEIQLGSTVKGRWYYICTWTQRGEDYPVINLKADNSPWFTSLYLRAVDSEFEWSYFETAGYDNTEYIFISAE